MASLTVSAKGGGKDFSIHPAGVYAARCTRIIDVGTHDTEYKGEKKKSHKIILCFESSELMGEDEGEFAGKPYLIINRYTASLSDKAVMRRDLESWRGRKFTPAELSAFNLSNVLGKVCMVNMIHSDPAANGKVYSNASSIMPLPAGMQAPAAVGELSFFSLEEFDQAAFDKLSDYYKELIKTSDEYKAMFAPKAPVKQAPTKAAASIDDDDIPF
jgi:hypothetical protein